MKQQVLQKIRLAVAILWGAILLGGLVWLTAYLLRFGLGDAKNELKALIVSSPDYAQIVYLLIFFLRGLFFIPVTILIIIGGALFPPVEAFFLALVGQVVSACIVYFLAQFVGRDFVRAHENHFLRSIDGALAEKGVFATLIMLIIPFVPIDSVAIVAGVTAISFADFLLGIFLGSIATILPFILLTNSLDHPFGLGMAILSFLFVLLVTLWAWKHPHFRDLFGRRKERAVISDEPEA